MGPEESWRLLVAQVGERRRSIHGRPVLIGIDGRSGSGKTSYAARLTSYLQALDHTCETVHLDDLYQGWSGLADALTPMCQDVLEPLLRGREARFQSWDWVADRVGATITVPEAQVVLVEGVGTLLAPCSTRLDLRVWLEAPAAFRRARALRRDGVTFAPHWDNWADQEKELLAAHGRPRADLLVDTTTGLLLEGAVRARLPVAGASDAR